MKSILVISERYWPYGGAELATHLILGILKSANPRLRINVLTGCRNPEQVPEVNYVYCSHLDARTKIHLWRNLLVMSETGWFRRLVKEADIVYIPRVAYPIIPLAKKWSKKVVVHLHDYQPVNFQSMILYRYYEKAASKILNSMKQSLMLEISEYNDLRRALASALLSPINCLCRFWLSQADDIICVSRRQAEIVTKELPELAKKVRVIYNPLPEVPKIEKSLTNPPSMLYMGGDLYTKGFHVFLNASYRLLRRGAKARFVLTRNFSGSSIRLIEKLNMKFNNPYIIMGYIKHDEVLRAHGICHAVLFPSVLEEPLPYAVIESMLAGTIPIASRVGGVPEIVEGTYAEKMLFEPSNVDELVERVEEILSLSWGQLLHIGANLRENVLKRFSEGAIRTKLLSVFQP